MGRSRIAWLIVVVLLCARASSGLGDELDAPDPDDSTRSKKYEIEWDHFSLRLGGGLLFDYATYDQSNDAALIMPLDPESGIRDLRLLVSGKTPWSRLTYTVGYMLDVAPNEWRFRQTGLKLQVPELGGFLFLGRTKEGFSTNKFMVGYYGWFNERSAVNDAFLPILGDGARWTASVLGGRLIYNLGAFADPISEKETFNKYDWQLAGRAVWLPLAVPEVDPKSGRGLPAPGPLLHLAGGARYAAADDGALQYRSKPESFLSQSFAVDTGEFEASRSTMFNLEAYYVCGPLSSGLEYFFNQVSSDAAGDPFFHGGEVFVAYLLTGETHPYNSKGGFFEDVVPKRHVFGGPGGPGAWELALRGSYVDLDSEAVEGGRFWRVTPAVNWYLTDAVRFEAVYGYGVVDRDGVEGGTQFFQTRVQLQVR